MLLAVITTLLGMAVLLLLVRAWRHHNERNRAPGAAPMPDLWQAGGDRLSAQLDQHPEHLPRLEEDHDDDPPPETPPPTDAPRTPPAGDR